MTQGIRRIIKVFRKPAAGLVCWLAKFWASFLVRLLPWLTPVQRENILKPHLRLLGYVRSSPIEATGKAPLFRAETLNSELFSDVLSILPGKLMQFEQEIVTFCNARNYGEEYTKHLLSHKFRYYLTRTWLESIIVERQGIIVLEMGGEGLATDILHMHFPQVNWQVTQADLRYPWTDISAESIDLIVSMEVLEHLSDLPDGINHGFFRTGLKAALKESYRVLKPGGVMMITTPNAGSIVHLESALAGLRPWFYAQHNREYTIQELIEELEGAGFLIHRWKAVHCLSTDLFPNHVHTFQMLVDYQHPTANRGDDLFIVAGK